MSINESSTKECMLKLQMIRRKADIKQQLIAVVAESKKPKKNADYDWLHKTCPFLQEFPEVSKIIIILFIWSISILFT